MFVACFVITEYCNMECDYCYMNNRRSSFMKPDVFEFHYQETLPYFMKHYGFDKYRLDLFGGEPTTYWNLIEYIINRTKNDKQLDHIFLPTNGLTLTHKDVSFLKNNNVKVSLSFDGMWSEKLRSYMKNPNLYKHLVDKCSVCVTPDHMNMSENFEFLMNEFQLIPEFKIVRDAIWNEDHVEQFKLELQKLKQTYFKYIKQNVKSFPFEHQLLMMLESRNHQMKKMRCFVGNSGVAFGRNKKVYPCARFLTDDYYPIYDENGVNTENLTIIDDFSNKFTDECMNCEQTEFCDNMCLHQELTNNGLLANVCGVYKAITEVVIDINHELKNDGIWRHYIKENINGPK